MSRHIDNNGRYGSLSRPLVIGVPALALTALAAYTFLGERELDTTYSRASVSLLQTDAVNAIFTAYPVGQSSIYDDIPVAEYFRIRAEHLESVKKSDCFHVTVRGVPKRNLLDGFPRWRATDLNVVPCPEGLFTDDSLNHLQPVADS